MKIENVERANDLRRQLADADQLSKRIEGDRHKAGVSVRYALHQYGNDTNTYQIEDPTLRELCFFLVDQQIRRTRAGIVRELEKLGVDLSEQQA